MVFMTKLTENDGKNFEQMTGENMEEYEKLSQAVIAYCDFLSEKRGMSYAQVKVTLHDIVMGTFNQAYEP